MPMEDFREFINSNKNMKKMNDGGMMRPMQPMAEALAEKGRFGDTMLVHMNPVEVQGLASLVPNGQLTINPDTGQPEAFLPLLLGLLGSGLGSAGLLGGNALLLGALGSGIGTTVETGSLKKGIQAGLMSGLVGGLAGKMFGATAQAAKAGTDAVATTGRELAKGIGSQTASDIARDAATKGVTEGIMGGIGKAGQALINPDNLAKTAAFGAVPGVVGEAQSFPEYDFTQANQMTEEEPYRRAVLRDRGFTPAPEGYRPGIDPEHVYFRNPFAFDLLTPEESQMFPFPMDPIRTMAGGGSLKEIPEGNKGLAKLPTDVRNNMGFMADGGLVDDEKKPKGYYMGGQFGSTPFGIRGMTNAPMSSYSFSQPSYQPMNPFYQPQYMYGGLNQSPMGASRGGKNRRQIQPAPPPRPSRPAKGAGFTPTHLLPQPMPKGTMFDRGDPFERDMYETAPDQFQRDMYVPPEDISANPDLAKPTRNLFEPVQDQNTVENPFERVPLTRGTPQENFANFFKRASLGQLRQAPNPSPFSGLGGARRGMRGRNRRRAEGGRLNMPFEGLLQGEGGGMDDIIPAVIDGKEPILVSRNEYVVPADVVSSLGDGSTNEGADMLDALVANTRIEKNGSPIQPKPLQSSMLELMERRV